MNSKKGKPAAHELQFNVAQLLKEPTGAVRTYGLDAIKINMPEEELTLVSPVSGHVKFLRTGPDILVTGELAAVIEKACGRCLTLFTAPVSFELEEQFYPTLDITTGTVTAPPEDADEENFIDQQHILDLLEVVRQGFLLESYGILYCQTNCKGLCPHCGRDRNLDPCSCEDENIDMRWAGLQLLQLDEIDD